MPTIFWISVLSVFGGRRGIGIKAEGLIDERSYRSYKTYKVPGVRLYIPTCSLTPDTFNWPLA